MRPCARGCWWRSLAINLGLLAFFKYGLFFYDSRRARCVALPPPPGFLAVMRAARHLVLHLPLDQLHRRHLPRHPPADARSFTDFALYVAFFPQLIAGPITPLGLLRPQLARRRSESADARRGGALPARLGLRQEGRRSPIRSARFVDRRLRRLGRLRGRLEAWLGALRLRVPDLLRLLGLLRHRASASRGCSASRCRRTSATPYLADEPERVLAPLAHLAVDVAARLPLHPARRQPAAVDCART